MRIIKSEKTKEVKVGNKIFNVSETFDIKKLQDITDVKDGTHDSPKYEDSGYPFITSKNLKKDNTINWDDVKYISKKDHDKFFKRSNVKKGDMLFGMIGTIGNPVKVNDDYIFSIKNVALIKGDNVDVDILRLQLLYSNIIRNQFNTLSQGGVLSFIKLSDIRNLKFINFEAGYQKKLLELLITQETHINNIKELISKLETRNEQMAERLLSGELRVREDANGDVEFYKNADDNWREVKLNGKMRMIPKDWGVDLLKNIIELKKGTSISSSLLNHDNLGDQYIRTNEIWDTSAKTKDPVFYNGDLKVNKKTDKDYIICFDGYNSNPKEGTLGMVTNNGIGIMSGELFKIGEIGQVSKLFVNLYYLKSSYFQELICRYGEGSTVKHAGKHLKKIDMPKIPTNEQDILNNFFESYEIEVNTLKSLVKKEKIVFEQLSEALLSGEYIIED